MTDPTPIVDVPISGGVQYGGTFGTQTDSPTDPGGGSYWGQYVWFNPLQLLSEQTDLEPGDLAFWCNTCGGQVTASLINIPSLTSEAPDYPSFTPQNISALGICQIFVQWMFSTFWAQQTGGTQAINPPVAPPGDTGPGEGTGGGG